MEYKRNLIFLAASIVCIAVFCVWRSNSVIASFSNSHLKVQDDQIYIERYHPVFFSIDDFLVIGVKIISESCEYRSPCRGIIQYLGDRHSYNKGESICRIDNPEIYHKAEHDRIKYEHAEYMYDYAKESREQSSSALTIHALKDFQNQRDLAKELQSISSGTLSNSVIKAPLDCTLQYSDDNKGMALHNSQVYEGQVIFSIASKHKVIHGHIPINLKSMNKILPGDLLEIIDAKGNAYKAKIEVINEPVSSTQGSVFFEASFTEKYNDLGINTGTALIKKSAITKCVVPSEHVYQGFVLVMLKSGYVVKRKCFNLRDGRITADVYSEESIIVPKDGFNPIFVDSVLNLVDTSKLSIEEKEYLVNYEDKTVNLSPDDRSQISDARNNKPQIKSSTEDIRSSEISKGIVSVDVNTAKDEAGKA